MKFKYTVTTKAIFPRSFTSTADTKEEIEAATGITITELDWQILERSGKRIVEDETFVLTIQKIK
jgi:hypothetical protein